jgi:hypothetical protein
VKLDPGTHKGMHLVLALKLGVTARQKSFSCQPSRKWDMTKNTTKNQQSTSMASEAREFSQSES